ncbi:MAG: flagellar hook-associated protein FlgK [Lachnospiraceae bacterium]|nr:flagellar hook-associated protein FlgK [Lachnospiraceae bacterium]
MANTFFGLTIGASGLQTYQAALNTTAHNASNVDTKGYTRQSTIRSANQAITISSRYGMAGTGVGVGEITQIRNEYYDEKFRSNNQIFGNYDSKEYYLYEIQNYFSEVNAEGTSASFDDFTASLVSLATSAGNTTIRTETVGNAQTLATYINYMYNSLQGVQDEANTDIKNTADRINSIAEEVASLTKQINTIEIRGENANDLRDARNLLIDELSEYANISISETETGDGIGATLYVVKLDGKMLVDTYNYNALVASPTGTSINQNDVAGLYNLVWKDGQEFNSGSPTLGGKLQALFEVRDGNNKFVLEGNANAAAGTSFITVTESNINNVLELNIPDESGVITIGSKEYVYKSFKVDVDENGNYKYTFELADGENIYNDIVNKPMSIGKSIDYKGIPYYMAQLNEFVRRYSQSFNNIHKSGEDFYGEKGVDFFNGIAKADELEFSFNETETGFTSLFATDELGQIITEEDGSVRASYYHVTAGNFQVSKNLVEDPRKIACAENFHNGIEDTVILNKLIALQSDNTLFKQGSPSEFLQTFTANIAIDAALAEKLATSQETVLQAIDHQRNSISGVDQDEEALDLVKFKNAYDLSSKVISVMNEIYNKLINETGV